MEIASLTRKFTFNGIDLADPGIALTPEQVKDFYSAVYPDITNAEIDEPKQEGSTITYTFRRAVGTKGAESLGVQLIAAERRRQLAQEGWNPEHDDEHKDGSMAQAAACYAARAASESALRARMPMHWVTSAQQFATLAWPWAQRWWKPKDRVRDLVRAGALIAAEIDRLQRRTEDTHAQD